MERRALWATVHGVAKSWTRQSDFTHRILLALTLYQAFLLFFYYFSSFEAYWSVILYNVLYWNLSVTFFMIKLG